MAKNWKGLKIQIDADVTGVGEALKGIDSTLRKTQSNLRETNKLLKFDPKNTILLKQQQEYLQEEISQTTQKLNVLKQAFEKAEEEIKSGDLGKEEFNVLQREIIKTEQKLNSYTNELKRLNSIEIDDAVEELKKEINQTEKEVKELNSTTKKIDTSKWKQLSGSTKKCQIDMEKLNASMKKVASAAKKAGDSMAKVAAKSFDIAKRATQAYTLALTAGAVAGVKYNSTIESYETSFRTMTGSAEKATEIVNKLKNIEAKTPFDLAGLAETTQLLMQYGFTADEAVDKMMMLGDISQGSAEKMNRIAAAYGQMSSAGKVQLEDIKQMIEAGFNPLQEISDTTGESMESLYNRISKGTISVDEITASMVRSTSEGGKYFKSLELQSQTLQGRLSTLKGAAMSTLGDLFTPLSNNLRDNVIPSVTKSFEVLQKELEKNGVSGFVDKLGGQIQLALVNISDSIKNNAVQFVSLGGSLLKDIVVGIGSQIPTLIPVGFEVINTIINGLLENIPMIIQQAQVILDTLVQGIKENAPLIINGAMEIIMALATFILQNLPMILDTAQQIMIALYQGLNNNIPTLLPLMINAILGLVDTIIKNAPLMIDASIQLILSLAEGLINSIPQLIDHIPVILENLLTSFIGNAPKLLGAGVELIIKLTEGLIGAIPKLAGKVPEIINSITNGFKKGFGEFLNIGKQIMINIWDGISSMGDWLWSKIKGMFSGISDFVAGIFGGGKSRTFSRALDLAKTSAKNVMSTFSNVRVMPTLRIAQPLNSPLELGINSLATILSLGNRPQNIYLNNREVARSLKDLGVVFK